MRNMCLYGGSQAIKVATDIPTPDGECMHGWRALGTEAGKAERQSSNWKLACCADLGISRLFS